LDRTGPALPSVEETRSPEELAREFEHRVRFFAERVAREFMLGSRWRDELESAGYWGLAKALANRRNGACERELSAYVSQRIRGAIIDGARRCLQQTRLVDVPDVADGNGGEGGDFGAAARRIVADPATRHGMPEEITEKQRLRQRVHDALEKLAPDDRALLHAYMSGSSLPEIARREGLPIGTVRARFDRVTRSLRGRASPMRRMGLHANR
jgi:RNA polymerase sigma factor (sigma-70 family)